VENGFADTVLEPLANLAQRAGTLQPTNIAMLQNAPAEVLALFDMTRVANVRTAAPSPMKRHPGPLMNAATETSAAGGGAAPAATPTPTPTAPVTPPIEPPTNQVPPPAAAPVVDLAGLITSAVTNAVKPLQDRLDSLEGLNRAGVSAQNLGGSAPVAGVVPDSGEAAPVKTPIDMKNMSAAQLINLGRKQLAAANKTQPLEQVPTP
jgi:hypothetical protein